MPVDPNNPHVDVAHPLSVQQFTRYGCWNKPREAGYYAPNREYEAHGWFRVRQVWIKNVMSRECRYDFRATDGLCKGCKK